MSDAVLVASEFVSNAVLHLGFDRRRLLEVRARLSRDRLRISVHGRGGCEDGASRRSVSDSEFRPWGTAIINRLSQRWGCERPDGYRVWADLALPA